MKDRRQLSLGVLPVQKDAMQEGMERAEKISSENDSTREKYPNLNHGGTCPLEPPAHASPPVLLF